MSTNRETSDDSQEEESSICSSSPIPQQPRGRPRGRPRGSRGRGRPRLRARNGPDHAAITSDLSIPSTPVAGPTERPARGRGRPSRGRSGRKRGRPRKSDQGAERDTHSEDAAIPSSPPISDTPTSRPRRRATYQKPKYSTDAFEVVGIDPEVKIEEDTDEESEKIHTIAQARDTEDDSDYEDHEQREDDEGGYMKVFSTCPYDNESDGIILGNDETPLPTTPSHSGPLSSSFAYCLLTQRKPYRRRSNIENNLTSVTPDNPLGNHTRGHPKFHTNISRPVQLRLSFGDDPVDLQLIGHVSDLWCGPGDATFPQRKSLAAALKATRAGHDPFDLRLQEEFERGWVWYLESLHRNPCRQVLRHSYEAGTAASSATQTRKYLPTYKGKMRVLMGPLPEQKLVEIEQGDVLDFSDAFASPEFSITEPPTTEKHDPKPRKNARPKSSSESTRRQGWLLNLGSKVQCLGWAPNCPDAKYQYLAVAVPVTDAQKVQPQTMPTTSAAFTPSPPHPAAIQIWGFEGKHGKRDRAIIAKLNMSKKPKLCQVICTDAGDIRRLSWCPCPRQINDENEGHLGLLGGVWSDGTVKVIDVKLNRDAPEGETEHAHLDVPFFEARVPATICTCFTWLSPSDIAIGHSNGFISLWNIATQTRKPSLYIPVHNTYILEISSAYPIAPDMITTASMDGHVRLISLTDPSTDVANAPRSRVTSSCLTYSPQLQAFFTSDESDFLRMYPQRRIFSSTSICKATSSVSAISRGSLSHPAILYGSVGGDAVISNPLSRALTSRGRHFEQKWFCYEWLRSPTAAADTDTGNENMSTGAGDSADAYAPGISRFIDLLPAEVPVLLATQLHDKRTLNGVAGLTIFEEETAVTSISWNPNASCASWAAAGMGSGLIRVEDLAIG